MTETNEKRRILRESKDDSEMKNPFAMTSEHGVSVGEILSHYRDAAGATLDQVADSLRIRKEFLVAIEANRPQDLPGSAYAVGFVRSYAEALGLSGEEAVRAYKRDLSGEDNGSSLYFPEPVPESRIPRGAILFVSVLLAGLAYAGWYYLNDRNLSVSDLVPAVPSQFGDDPVAAPTMDPQTGADSFGDRPAAPAENPPTDQAATPAGPGDQLAAAPPLGNVVESPGPAAESAPENAAGPSPELSFGAGDGQPADAPGAVVSAPPPAAPAGTDTAAPAGTPEAEVSGVSGPPAPASSAPDAAAAPVAPMPPATPDRQAAAAAVPPVPPVRAAAGDEAAPQAPQAPPSGDGAAAGPPEILIRATADSWIQVRAASGALVMTRILREGDSYTVPSQTGLSLTTGNAGALRISVNGRPVPPIGEFGDVRRDLPLDPEALQGGL